MKNKKTPTQNCYHNFDMVHFGLANENRVERCSICLPDINNKRKQGNRSIRFDLLSCLICWL